jgi:phytoene/squalene synthetase
MIKNPDIARQISDLMNDVFQRLYESTDLVKRTCTAEEFAEYNRAAAGVVGPIVMDVMEPLYEDNPNLKPANWDEPPWHSEPGLNKKS